MRVLCLATLALATSCSLQLDSQYGIRIGPAPKGPQERHVAHAQVLASEVAEATETSTWAFSADSEVAVRELVWSAEPEQSREVFPDTYVPQTAQTMVPEPAASPEFDAVADQNPSVQTEADVPPQPEPNMLTAWLMWGIPVVLMLAGVGFLLNFGLHWYYLGKQRRANSATYIWALTLAGFVAIGLLRFLKLGLLALLVFLIVLIPLMAIQLIRAVKDAFLLNKMATRLARRAERKRGPSI